jgi:hypothetical protein
VLEFYLLNLVGDKKFFGQPLPELINLAGDSRSLRFLLGDDFFLCTISVNAFFANHNWLKCLSNKGFILFYLGRVYPLDNLQFFLTCHK